MPIAAQLANKIWSYYAAGGDPRGAAAMDLPKSSEDSQCAFQAALPRVDVILGKSTCLFVLWLAGRDELHV